MRGGFSGGRTRGARLTAMLVAGAALALAQILVSLTHAPAVPAEVVDLAAHEHAHGDARPDLLPGHDAADHEHQLQALAVGPGEALILARSERRRSADVKRASLPQEGMRRPPRPV